MYVLEIALSGCQCVPDLITSTKPKETYELDLWILFDNRVILIHVEII
jgi:hypothetical protein